LEQPVTEEAHFLEVSGQRVFAVFSRPQGPAARGVVLCHPLGEEKLWAHRALVAFSRELVARGFAVIRFDFRGEGDSESDFQDSSVETRLEDIAAVVKALRQREPSCSDVSLVGLRFGATMAVLSAAGGSDIRGLALWDPIVDGAAYGQSLLRINLASQLAAHRKVVEGRDKLVDRMTHGETVNIEGYALTGSFYNQIVSLRVIDVLPVFRGRTLILQPGTEGSSAGPGFGELAIAGSKVTVSVVDEQPFWKETRAFLQRADGFARSTIDWLESAS
jgi:exosortase A-associated hydrolase 2